MNKKLLIIRHAKSDWGDNTLHDFDRTLNKRGFDDAPEMGKRIKKFDSMPDKFVSSSAIRALTTAKIIAKEINYPEKNIDTDKNIYEASAKKLLSIINNFDNKYNFVALFGHNNGITDVVNMLTNSGIANIPTCGLVLIDFPFDDWKVVSAGTGNLLSYDLPKNADD